MLYFRYPTILFISCIISVLLNCNFVTESAGLPFGASVFPLLTTGWYYKPGPTEALVLGLIVVKILALKLAATLGGVPYHLNDLFDSKSRGKRDSRAMLENGQNSINESFPADEIAALERILLALRRIDSHDCFIRYICQVNQNLLKMNSTSPAADEDDNTWIEILRLKPKQRAAMNTYTSIWDIYDEALRPYQMDCNKKYEQCPLTEKDLTRSSLLSGIL